MSPLFKISSRGNKDEVLSIAKKSNIKKSSSITVKKGANQTITRINEIKMMVEKNLGHYKDEYIVITEKEVLHDYITACIGNNYISIDTETDGLDPLTNMLAGICPYTPGQKGAYIPLNHISYVTGNRIDSQLPIDFVRSEFNRLLVKKPDIDMFNAKFDIRFLRANGFPDIYCTWDGYLASMILNENELTHQLKPLHQKYVLNGQGDAFTFDSLFKGIPFTKIPYNVGYLYAAHDPVITTELCDYQRKYLRPDSARQDIQDMYWVFKQIEMPCISVIADMEDDGISFDTEYAQQLSVKYTEIKEQQLAKFYELLKPYEEAIEKYKRKNPGVKLDTPLNVGSPTQLAILFYDILKVPPVDRKSPRGTGEEILKKIDNPLCKAILDYRETGKLLSTYIDKLPNCVNPKDGKIHCSFKQYGAKTGRMASEDPNLQNIPSHNKDVRKMFTASPGHVLLSSDFSQQEPKCLAALCRQQGDSQMYDTFMAGKDIYGEIGSKSFHKPYAECLEFFPDGTVNKEGKERRNAAKRVLLGVLYGRGTNSVAEQLGCSKQEAEKIKNSVFKGFPAIKKFEEDSKLMAQELGYVTTVCGRKRRLPDLNLEEFEFSWKDGAPPDDDLLNFDAMNTPEYITSEVPDKLKQKYLRKLKKAWGSEKQSIFQEAREEGILIKDNGAKIADAERQVVNARIQGSAADLTKLAMIELNNNSELKKLGFKLLIPVHDEVIAECPEENAKECSKLLAETMSHAAEEILRMPIRCDVECSREWYGESLNKKLGLEIL